MALQRVSACLSSFTGWDGPSPFLYSETTIFCAASTVLNRKMKQGVKAQVGHESFRSLKTGRARPRPEPARNGRLRASCELLGRVGGDLGEGGGAAVPVDAQLLEWTSSQGGRALRLVVKMTFEGYLPSALCPVTRCMATGA